MNTKRMFLYICLLSLSAISSSQGVQISPLKLEFDGRQLSITYDFNNSKESDQFYVWVEMEKKDGQSIKIRSVTGDVGDTRSGKNKKITWDPGNDSIFLDEEVSVEVKAERYEKSFNKGSMMLMSTLVPGLGQSKISNGKPYWLMGVASYGALAGGVIVNQSYKKTYDSYLIEEDPVKRSELLDKAQSQKDMAGVLIISGAAIWAANLIWVATIPNKYKPLKHAKLSLIQPAGPLKGTTLLSLKVNF